MPQNQLNEPYEKIRDSLLFLLSQTGVVLELIKDLPDKVTFPIDCRIITEHDHFDTIPNYFDKLEARIMDKTSKILVTGDLNAGKSTFCNTLLRRQIVPDDQEPCTAMFIEVVDSLENEGVEEVHAIFDPSVYLRHDSSTFTIIPLERLREHVERNEQHYQLLKVYCKDKRTDSLSGFARNSLLHNGVVDISLIDSPGLK